jgi:hypothetical protein
MAGCIDDENMEVAAAGMVMVRLGAPVVTAMAGLLLNERSEAPAR